MRYSRTLKIELKIVFIVFRDLGCSFGIGMKFLQSRRLVQTDATIGGLYVLIPNGIGSNQGQTEAVDHRFENLRKGYNMTKFSAFLNDETGAVTVDWVVLTAAVVGLGLVVFTFIQPAISTLASDIGIEVTKAGTAMKNSDPTN